MRVFPPSVPALYCCLFQVTGILAELYVKAHNITATAGSDVTLRCELSSDDASVVQVNWEYCNGLLISVHVPDKGQIKPRFTEKVALTDKYGITIRNVTNSDTNQYCCTFSVFPKGSLTGKIFLQVTEKKTLLQYPIWGALGAIIFTIIGISVVICYKNFLTPMSPMLSNLRKAAKKAARQHLKTKSRWLRNNIYQTYYTNPAVPLVELSAPSTDRDISEDNKGPEYFNILLYRQPEQ